MTWYVVSMCKSSLEWCDIRSILRRSRSTFARVVRTGIVPAPRILPASHIICHDIVDNEPLSILNRLVRQRQGMLVVREAVRVEEERLRRDVTLRRVEGLRVAAVELDLVGPARGAGAPEELHCLTLTAGENCWDELNG